MEDDIRLANLVTQALEENLHSVVHLESGYQAASYIKSRPFDVVLLDLMLPGVNGLTVLKELRQSNCQIPVIILSARDTVPEMVHALDIGADDYLTKPFHFEILLARLRSASRRGIAPQRAELVVGPIALRHGECSVRLNGGKVGLTRREYMLLETLMRRPDQVFTRDQLAEAVWGLAADVSKNNLDVHMHSLRSKLGPLCGSMIQTVRGIGYVLQKRGASIA